MNDPGDNDNNDRIKEALKDALKEWLDEKFLLWGKWSMGALLAVALTGLTYVILKGYGWTKF